MCIFIGFGYLQHDILFHFNVIRCSPVRARALLFDIFHLSDFQMEIVVC